MRIGALGSGSDYTVFLDHLTVASVNTAFRVPVFGVYHSIYDSFDWYRRFGDPQFAYGRALAQVHAVALSRMANAEVLPFEFTNLADTIGVYLDELDQLLTNKRKKDASISLDLKPLRGGLDALGKAAQAYEKTLAQALGGAGPTSDVSRANAALRQVEQAMRLEGGLPGQREWFKHSPLRAGLLHRIRRKDNSRRARGDRARRLDEGKGAGRCRAGRLRQGGGPSP